MVSVVLIGALIIIGTPILLKLISRMKQGKNKYFPDMQNKVVLVTGGNAGIGKETARLLYQLNATVIITGRDKAKAQAFLEELPMHTPKRPKMKFYPVDFSDLESVKQFADIIKSKYKKIDILVNNAGCVSYTHRLSKQGIEFTMAVNHVAPVYLTSLLINLLADAKREARVVNVSSIGQVHMKKLYKPLLESKNIWNTKINKNAESGQKYSMMGMYGLSKLANVAFKRGLAKLAKTKSWNLKTAALHLGTVYTDIWRTMDEIAIVKNYLKPIVVAVMKFFMRTEAEGAATIQHLSLCPFDELKTGGYYGDCKVSDKLNEEDLEKYGAFI